MLLVEDNPEVAKVTRGYLEEFGYAVRPAADVAAARAELHAHAEDIDLVLSDIVMPGGANGLDLARWIRDEFGASLPVVLATGYSDRTPRRRRTKASSCCASPTTPPAFTPR